MPDPTPNTVPVSLTVTPTAPNLTTLKDLLVSLIIPLAAIVGIVVLAAIGKVSGDAAVGVIVAAAGLHVAAS